jgi:hypothetical protein
MEKRKLLKLEIGKSYRLRPIINPWDIEKPYQETNIGSKYSIKKIAQYYYNLDDNKVYCLISSRGFIRKINEALESGTSVSNPIVLFQVEDLLGKLMKH